MFVKTCLLIFFIWKNMSLGKDRYFYSMCLGRLYIYLSLSKCGFILTVYQIFYQIYANVSGGGGVIQKQITFTLCFQILYSLIQGRNVYLSSFDLSITNTITLEPKCKKNSSNKVMQESKGECDGHLRMPIPGCLSPNLWNL